MSEQRDKEARRSADRWLKYDKLVRDTILFVVGTAGIVNELFILTEPRPSALIFLGSLVGLPFVLQQDERRRNGDDKEEARQ